MTSYKIDSSKSTARLTTGIMTVVLLLNLTVTPILAESTTISNSDNGSGSSNSATVEYNQQSTSSQNNNSSINNTIEQNSNTGGNDVSGNSGDVTISTGDISTQSALNNNSGYNVAQVNSDCNDCSDDVTIINQDNGNDSSNAGTLYQNNDLILEQSNDVVINNSSVVWGETGNNVAKDNGGSVFIKTGDVQDKSLQQNSLGSNSIVLPSASQNGSVWASNESNGHGSQNNLNLQLNTNRAFIQNNNAKITNNVHKSLNTGGNVCKDNWECEVLTGGITSKSKVANNAGGNSIGGLNPSALPTPTPVPSTLPEPTKGDEAPVPGSITVTPTTTTWQQVAESVLAMAQPTPAPTARVLAMHQLPATGAGTQVGVSWQDLVLGLLVLMSGLILKQGVKEESHEPSNR